MVLRWRGVVVGFNCFEWLLINFRPFRRGISLCFFSTKISIDVDSGRLKSSRIFNGGGGGQTIKTIQTATLATPTTKNVK